MVDEPHLLSVGSPPDEFGAKVNKLSDSFCC